MREANVPIYWDTLDSRTGYTVAMYPSLSISAAASAFGRPVNLNGIWLYTVQIVIAGATSPVGTLVLQGSNDSLADPSSPAIKGTGVNLIPLASAMTWTDIAGSSVAVAANNNWVWNAADVGYEWVRAKWTYTSGTGGTLSGRIKTKGM